MTPDILISEKMEEAIIGSLIWQDEIVPVLMPKLSVDTFTSTRLRAVFEGIKKLYDAGKDIDALKLEQWLKDEKGWKDHEIQNITSLEGIYSNHEDTVDNLNDRKSRRELFNGLRSILNDIQSEAEPTSHFLGKIERLINDQVEDIQIPGLTYSEVLAKEAEKPENQKLWIDDPFMQETFFSETGFHKGEIMVPFADTGAGKTYFAVWMAKKLLESGHKGVFVIRESRAKKLFERFERSVDDKTLLDNLIVADIEQGISNLNDAVATIKYHNALSDIDFFVVDHLKILPVDGLKEWEEGKRITTCINRLIYLSQEVNALGIPISQVNRQTLNGSHGWGKEPGLPNIYGSSAIEQAAHLAVSIFRPSNYEELCIYDSNGELSAVKGPNYSNNPGDKFPPNSVFIAQKKVREGRLYRKRVQFLHTDKGLVREAKKQSSMDDARKRAKQQKQNYSPF